MSQIEAGHLPNIEVTALYTDQVNAYCIERARKYHLDVHINELKNFDSKADYERKIIEWLTTEKVEWIILAGYMKLIGENILNAYQNVSLIFILHYCRNIVVKTRLVKH